MTKQEVIDTIQQAFAGVPMPAPEKLTRLGAWAVEAAKRGMTWEDSARTTYIFMNKKWQDVDFEEIKNESAPLSMLTPEAVHYYLPTFLINALIRPEDMDTDRFRWELSPPPFGTSTPEEFEKRYSLLTLPQQQAIAQYLEYVREQPEYGTMYDESNAPWDCVTTYWRDNYLLPENTE